MHDARARFAEDVLARPTEQRSKRPEVEEIPQCHVWCLQNTPSTVSPEEFCVPLGNCAKEALNNTPEIVL